jgi:phosphonoacetaldehyde hydrolase
MDDTDVDRLYQRFTPMNRAAVPRHAQLIDGVAALVRGLRERGLKIGSTTGYNREIMAVLAPLAAAQGFVPDNLVCAGDVSESRPAPLGMYRCFIELGVWPAHREVGLSAEAWDALPPAGQAERRALASTRLAAARPDYTIDTVAELLPVLDAIERRLAAGERPPA